MSAIPMDLEELSYVEPLESVRHGRDEDLFTVSCALLGSDESSPPTSSCKLTFPLSNTGVYPLYFPAVLISVLAFSAAIRV